jgi:hypothetical protein
MRLSPRTHAVRPLPFLVFGFALISTLTFAQTSPQEGGPRLRPTDARTADLLKEGIERSPTVRKLVERIESGDVVVYIGSELGMPRLLLGSLTWVGANDTFRFVRASIRATAKTNALIATVAHELQHVVELIDAPWVNSQEGLRELYVEIGERISFHEDIWDTARARWTTQQVMRELGTHAADDN